MYVLVGFLLIGLICNLLVRPVDPALFTTTSLGGSAPAPSGSAASRQTTPPAPHWGGVAVAWLLVSIPLGWGVYQTLALTGQLFAR